MTAKISFLPQTTRTIVNVYAFLVSSASPLRDSLQASTKPDPEAYYLSEESYRWERDRLLQTESTLLRRISFVTQVVLPYHLALSYLKTLGVLPSPPTRKSTALAARTLAHLNTGLFSPQLLYLTHQPSALAVAAVYLAARQVGSKLTSTDWWEVFDVDREQLGFLVVGLGSCESWMKSEKQRWVGRNRPLTLSELEAELPRWSSASQAESPAWQP